MSTTISSAFGYAGVVANLIWPTLTRRTHLLMGQVIACGLMLTHFALLNAHSGAWIMGTAGLQALLAIPLGQSPRFKILYLLSLPLTPLICALTWQGPQSIFSSMALALVCVANFQLSPLRQRLWLITAIFAWITHNLLIASTAALVSNTFALGISTWMLIKIWRSKPAKIKVSAAVRQAKHDSQD